MAHTPKFLDLAVRTAVKALDGKYRQQDVKYLPLVVQSFDVLNRLVNWGVECEITLAAGLLYHVEENSPAIGGDWLAQFVDLASAYGMQQSARQVYFILSFGGGNNTLESFMVRYAVIIHNIWDLIYARNGSVRAYFNQHSFWIVRLNQQKVVIESKYSPKVFRRADKDWDAIKEHFAGA
jgi:hypothetical protein